MRGLGSLRTNALLAGLVVISCSLPAQAAVEQKTGFLIPSQCQPEKGVEKGADLHGEGSADQWPAPHTTKCALRPGCIESGYGLWVVDRFYRFDDSGQRQALDYFKTTERTSYNKVRVSGDFDNADSVRVEAIEESIDAANTFERLKEGLVGNWEGTLEPLGSPVEVTFHLAGNGSALIEDIQRLDKDTRMHTVYHLDGDDLRLTHFCSYRNQPRLKAKSMARDGDSIDVEFELVDITNLSQSGPRYTRRILLSLVDEQRASITYFGVDESVDDGGEGQLTAELTRLTPAES